MFSVCLIKTTKNQEKNKKRIDVRKKLWSMSNPSYLVHISLPPLLVPNRIRIAREQERGPSSKQASI